MSGVSRVLTAPRRQLTSVMLRQSLKAFIVPPVLKSYEVVAIRAVWHTDDDDRRETELHISPKRRQIELLLQEDNRVMLYVSAITGLEKEKPHVKKTDAADGEDDNEGNDEENNDRLGQPNCYPGVAFWIAYNAPRSTMKDIENQLEKELWKAGLNIYECKTIKPRGKQAAEPIGYATATLSQVIKDHNWPYAIDIAKESTEAFVHRAFNNFEPEGGIASDQGPHFVHSTPEFGKKVVKIVLTENCNSNLAAEFKNGLKQITPTKFEYDLVDMTIESTDGFFQQSTPTFKGSGTLTQCIDIIRRVMDKQDYRLYKGKIFSKVPESKFTFIYCSPVAQFLDALLANPEFTELMAPNLKRLEEILCRPGCAIIPQIKINYNLIEVRPFGYCFNIPEKAFQFNPLNDSDIGNVTPRAYVSYTYNPDRVPHPKPFVDSLENSFEDNDTRIKFIRKYYQLLLHKQFPMKTRKLCVVGETDSGKTAWFSPFQGIIPTANIAGVTREKQFAGHLITDETEIVFMDEWSTDSLNAEDAKKVLQGGLLMLPQKHKNAEKTVYRSGFYITTNEMPDFGEGPDGRAIERRLSVFTTQPIPNPRNRVSDWYRKNAMCIFHYCAVQLKDQPLFSEDEDGIDDDQGNVGYESDQGTLYNDYEGKAPKLLRLEGLKTVSLATKEVNNLSHDDTLHFNLVPRETLDRISLKLDAEQPERWTKDHPMFDNSDDISTVEYHEKVLCLAVGKWRSLDVSLEDLERFQRRRNLNWEGGDTLYDCFLLVEKTPREAFNYDLFLERHPGWPELWEARYGNGGLFNREDAAQTEAATGDVSTDKTINKDVEGDISEVGEALMDCSSQPHCSSVVNSSKSDSEKGSEADIDFSSQPNGSVADSDANMEPDSQNNSARFSESDSHNPGNACTIM